MISAPALKVRRFGETPAEETGVNLAVKLHAPDIAALRAMDAAALTKAAVPRALSRSASSTARCCRASLSTSSTAASRRPSRSSPASTAARSALYAVLPRRRPASAGAYDKVIRERYLDLAPTLPAALSRRDDAWTASSRRPATRSTAGPPSGSCGSRRRSASRHIFTSSTTAYPAADNAGLHAFHASEVPFVFGTIDRTPPVWPKPPPTSTKPSCRTPWSAIGAASL